MWRMAIKYLTFLPIIVISFAQDAALLFQLYNERNMEELKKQLITFKESDEKTFFQALFIHDADSSAEIYKELYVNATETLKPLVARKLYEYYYAKGFYVTAQRYETGAVESSFEIQLGAFLSKENADDFMRKLDGEGLETYVITKEVNQKTYYCVRIHGKETLEATNVYAEQIGIKFRVKYSIIK